MVHHLDLDLLNLLDIPDLLDLDEDRDLELGSRPRRCGDRDLDLDLLSRSGADGEPERDDCDFDSLPLVIVRVI